MTPRDQVVYFQPQVAIDAAGRIAVMAFAMSRGRVSVVLMLSELGSLRFSPPITITQQPFNPAQSGFGRSWWIGDCQALATSPGAFHPLWNDTRTGQLHVHGCGAGRGLRIDRLYPIKQNHRTLRRT